MSGSGVVTSLVVLVLLFAAVGTAQTSTTTSSTTALSDTTSSSSSTSTTTSHPTPTPTSTPTPTPTPFPGVSFPCLYSWLDLLPGGNISETLAIMIDATGKSIDDLGKWDQCRDLGSSVTQYCTIDFATPLPIPTPAIGVCITAQCTASEMMALAKLGMKKENKTKTEREVVKALEYLIYYNTYNKTGDFHFECIHDTEPISASTGSIVMVFISFMLAGLCVIGTLLDGWDAHWWPEKKIGEEGGSGSIQAEDEGKALLHKTSKPKPKWFDFLVAFSVVRNFKSLMGPSPPALAFLNGMRAISIMWVILGHSLDYMDYAGVLNFAHVVTRDVLKTSAQVFPAAEFSVDSFFWLSGFLVTYLSVNEIKSIKHLGLYYFHRVWRLSPAYYYALFFYMYISSHIGNGPLWPKYEDMILTTCGKYWWTNVLYVNNFIPANNWNGQCFLWGWYLAVDMQLYIIAPILFLFYRWNRVIGYTVVGALIVVSTALNGVFAHVHDLQWNSEDPHVYMSLVYGKPYTRAAPWLLGIICGFLYLEKTRVKRMTVYIGWVISAVLMVLTVYGPVTEFSIPTGPLSAPNNNWADSKAKNFMYFTFSKLAWSLALSFIMYSMAAGYGGFVRRFLGASFWSPLARLTYSTYLFHPIIMFVVYFSHLQYFSYDSYSFSIYYVGEVFLAFCMGGVIFLALERPMVNMEKLFLPHKKR